MKKQFENIEYLLAQRNLLDNYSEKIITKGKYYKIKFLDNNGFTLENNDIGNINRFDWKHIKNECSGVFDPILQKRQEKLKLIENKLYIK